MKNRMSIAAIKLDLGHFFLEYDKEYHKDLRDSCYTQCVIYVCRRKGYALKDIGKHVNKHLSTVYKEFLKIEAVLDSGEESDLRTCLVMCKIRFSC